MRQVLQGVGDGLEWVGVGDVRLQGIGDADELLGDLAQPVEDIAFGLGLLAAGVVDKGEFDASMSAWWMDLDPDLYDTFHSSQVPPKGLNHVFYSNAMVDSLLEAGRTEFDQDKRAAIYHDIHRIMHAEQPYTFINSVPMKRIINKRIKNVVISPSGPFDFYPGANVWYIDEGTEETAKR